MPISYRGAGRPPEQGRCALHRARGGGAHRAGPCAAARAGARRCRAALQNCAGHGARFFHAAAARSALQPRAGTYTWHRSRQSQWSSVRAARRSALRRRPALQPRAGTYTWHRSRQSQWSSVRAARRSALRCATPPRPFRKLSSAENFGFTDPTNCDHPLSRRHETLNLDWNEFRNAEP